VLAVAAVGRRILWRLQHVDATDMPTVEGPPRVDRRAAGKNHGRRIRAQHCGLNMTRPRAPPWRTAAPALPRGFGHPALGAPFAHHLVTSSSSCHPSLGPVHSGASHRVHMSRRKRAKPSARTSVTDGRPDVSQPGDRIGLWETGGMASVTTLLGRYLL